MAKKKKNEGDISIAGRIITIFFLLFLVAGGYYLFSMFRPVEITQVNIIGEWKLPGAPVTYYSFRADGTAMSYEKFTGSGDTRNQTTYTYSLVEETDDKTGETAYMLYLYEDRSDKVSEIKITGLSHVQMNVLWKRSEFASLTRVDVF